MALFTIKNPNTYHFINFLLKGILTILLITSLAAYNNIIKGLLTSKNETKFCYALFAATAIISNSLLALGRSNIFMERYTSEEQKPIFNSSIMFICSTMLNFFLAGWSYLVKDDSVKTFDFFKPAIPYVVQFSLIVGLGASFILIGIGLYQFFKWGNLAFDKYIPEKQK